LVDSNSPPPALIELIAALDAAFIKGAQFYAMPIGPRWLAFYNGPAYIH